MEYTKGEWKVIPEMIGKKLISYGVGTNSTDIALMISRDLGKAEANAQLIAAAPDLYEVCKKVRMAYNIHFSELDKALAKAEGK